MKEEVLRMDRVTYIEQGITELNHFCLDIDAGEIIGLIPVNDTGLAALMKLMRQNLPLHYGYVYYRGRLVNHWRKPDYGVNRSSVIESRCGLADDLTVADNVFVLRQGFKKMLIHRRVLNRQLEPFLKETGADLSAGACVRDLTGFQRFIAELVKAVVADCRLIVLMEPGSIVSDARLESLQRILRYYAAKGFSFLYVSRHYEEARQICTHAAVMINGQIAKVVSTAETSPEVLQQHFGVEAYTQMVRRQERVRFGGAGVTPALTLNRLRCGNIASLDLAVAPGECVVLQDLNNHILNDLIRLLSGVRRPDGGEMLVDGRAFRPSRRRRIAVIQQQPAETMVFPELSYMDNLCFTLDHRIADIWRRAAPQKSIRRELAPLLGADVFDTPCDALTQAQKYDLVYTRVLLQRPSLAVCVQPFMGADVERRMQVWKLVERLLGKGVAVLILAVNLADSLSLADRLVRVRDGRVQATYGREEFVSLPPSAPWHDFWAGARKADDWPPTETRGFAHSGLFGRRPHDRTSAQGGMKTDE
jgi:ribose transport system ATP-binding protein